MAAPKVNYSLVKRQLQSLSFAENQTLSRDIPTDSTYVAIELRLHGSFVTTYASGTPVADIDPFDNLCKRIEIAAAGGNVIKNVRPYMLRMRQFLINKNTGERKCSAAASAAVNDNPTVDAGMTFGATTQTTTLAETVIVPFEDKLARQGQNHKTYFNARGISSFVLRLYTGAMKNLQNVSDATSITYSANTLTFDIFTIEAPAVQSAYALFRQTYFEAQFTAQVSDMEIRLNTGAHLRGLGFMVRNGDSTQSLSNNALKKIRVVLNGTDQRVLTYFDAIQASNRAKYGLNVPYASNVSPIDGFAYLDFLTDGVMETAVSTRLEDGVNSLKVFVDTAAAGSGSTYSSGPVTIGIMQDEYVLAGE